MGRAFEYRKARKMARWSKMSKQFTRIGKEIVMAVKESGPDPDTNARLRSLIQNAKDVNMPKDNIERAIKRASDKDTEDYKNTTFEGYGPHGIAFFIETATDNNNRTVANVRSYFTKVDGSLGVTGSVDFMFDRMCYFELVDKEEVDHEMMELELIDYGVEELNVEDGIVTIYAPFESYGDLQTKFEKEEWEIKSSDFERIPNHTKSISEKEQEDIQKLIDLLEDDDDVQNVYHNMEE